MAATTADLVKKFLTLDGKKKKHEGDLEAVKEEMAKLEPDILKRFEEANIQSMKTPQGQVVYVRRDLFAGAADGADQLLLDVLKSIGLGDMVKEKVNSQTLSAWVREQEKEAFGGEVRTPDEILKALPEPIQPALKVSEKFSLRARKG